MTIGTYATFQWLRAACLSLFANISINKIFCKLQVYFTKGKNSHFISLNRCIEINVLAEMRIFLMADVLAISHTFKISFVHQIIWGEKKQCAGEIKFLKHISEVVFKCYEGPEAV